MLGFVGVASRTSERTLLGDLNRQKRFVTRKDTTPCGKDISILHEQSLITGSQYPSRTQAESKYLDVQLVEATGHSLESASGLTHDPVNNASIIIAIPQVVVQCREAVFFLARLLHFVQLLCFKLMIFDRPPSVLGRIHREAGHQRPIDPND